MSVGPPGSEELIEQSKTQRWVIIILSLFLGFVLVLNTFYFYRLNSRADAEHALIGAQQTTINNLQSQLNNATKFNQLLGSLIIEGAQNPQQPLTPTQKQTLAKLQQLLNAEASTTQSVNNRSPPRTTTTTFHRAGSSPTTVPRQRPPPASSTTTTTTTTLLVCVKVPSIHVHVGC